MLLRLLNCIILNFRKKGSLPGSARYDINGRKIDSQANEQPSEASIYQLQHKELSEIK